MNPTTTLILGGGFGGLAAAYTLRALIPLDHKIVMIDKTASFHVGATKTWVMLGEKSREKILRDRKSLIPGNVDFLEAEIEAVNPALGEVRTNKGNRKADFLIIALGADVNMSAVTDIPQHAHTFYTVEGAVRLEKALKAFNGGEIVILIPRTPFKCPPAPYEAAMLLQNSLAKRGLQESAKISICTVEPLPMPTAGPETGTFVRGLVEKQGIGFYPLRKMARIDGSNKRIFFEDGSTQGYDLLIVIPPHESPRVVRDAGLTNQSGWIPVNPKTMQVTVGESAIPVYAVGDITSVPLPGRFKPDVPLVLPKAGVFAASQGVVAAHQIARRILNKAIAEEFDGKGFCYIEVGDDRAVKGEGTFFALPNPMMVRREPDRGQFNDKIRWVEQWLAGSFSELLPRQSK